MEYKILESPNKNGTLTIQIEDDNLSFNHTHIHKKDEYEAFGMDDFGIEKINEQTVYHINGHIITINEYQFIQKTIDDL